MRPTRTAARRRGAGCCEPCLPGRTCHNLLLWTAVRGASDDSRPLERGRIGRVGCRSLALRKLVREQRGRRRGSRCLCRAEPATAMPVGASPSCCGRRGDRLGRAAHIAIIAPLVSVSTTELNKAMITVSKRRLEQHEQGLPLDLGDGPCWAVCPRPGFVVAASLEERSRRVDDGRRPSLPIPRYSRRSLCPSLRPGQPAGSRTLAHRNHGR
jgi:hypothetical protein